MELWSKSFVGKPQSAISFRDRLLIPRNGDLVHGLHLKDTAKLRVTEPPAVSLWFEHMTRLVF
jgi:hypothetical protein